MSGRPLLNNPMCQTRMVVALGVALMGLWSAVAMAQAGAPAHDTDVAQIAEEAAAGVTIEPEDIGLPAIVAPQAPDVTAPPPLPADDFAALEHLLELAPSRHLSQPGNEAIDRFVKQRFAAAAAERNERHAEQAGTAREAFDRAEAAREALQRVSLDKQLLDDGGGEAQVVESFWMVRYTLEDPGGLSLMLLTLAALFLLVAWWQKRMSVVYAAVAMTVVALVLPMLAWLIETEAERAVRSGEEGLRTRAQLEDAYERAMRDAGRADREAAEALDGLWQHGRVRYPVTTFEPGEAHLTLTESDRTLRVHQMAPNLAEPANLPEAGHAGPMVYLGRGRPADLAGKSLDGAVVLMDFDSGRRWVQAVEMGAAVVVFVSPEDASEAEGGGGFNESRTKRSFSPVSVPRFYMDHEALVDAVGEQWRETLEEEMEVELHQAPGRWIEKEAATDWLFIPGTGEGLDDGHDRSLVHLQAYKDSNSIVPERAPGAQSGANLVLMMRLLEHFEAHPPARSVLLSAVNAHTSGLHGEDMFAWAAFADPGVVRDELAELDRTLARQRFVERVYRQGPSEALLERLVTWIEPIGGRMFSVKDPIVQALNTRRNRLMREAHHHQVRVDRAAELEAAGVEPELTPAERDELRERAEALREEGDQFLPLMRLFVRYGASEQPAELEHIIIDEETGRTAWNLLEAWFERTADRAGQHAEALARQRQRLLDNLSIRRRLMALDTDALAAPIEGESSEDLFERRYAPLPSTAAVCLDLSFGSDQAGFFTHGYLTDLTEDFGRHAVQRVSRLAGYTLEVSETYEQETGASSPLVSTLRMAGGLSWQTHLPRNLELGSRVMHEYARLALTLTAVQDMRPEAFSPQDTPARIHRPHFDTLMGFARDYLPRLVDAPRLEAQHEDRGSSRTLAIGLRLHTLDDFSLELATAEAPGALLLAWPGDYLHSEARMLGQVTPWGTFTSDIDGRVTLRASRWQGGSMQAFDFEDETFRTMSAALDFGEGMRQLGANASLGVRTTGYRTRNLVLTGAEKIDLFGVTQALTLMPASTVELLTAAQVATPRHYSVAGVQERAAGNKAVPLAGDGTASLFVEPGTRLKLTVDNAPVIAASEARPDGVGFPSDVGRLRNLTIQSARDMTRLNHARLDLLEDRGVTEETARHYNEHGRTLLERMDEAERQDRPDVMRTTAEEARGLAFRSYQMTMGTINDLIQAVVVVLGLIIPASFFLMKLVTPFTNVNAQLGMFGLLFAVLAALLQLVHPAFYIADTPQVIVLAFIILGLAIFVSSVIMSRFNTSMNQAVEESQMSEAVEAPRGRLAGVAFMVGVNNMKRRRIRTTLTAATVVLVTFTSLSVMSVGRSGEPVRVPVRGEAPYDGFAFARPGMSPIETSQLQNLEAHFQRDAQTVRRLWVQERGENGEYLPMRVFPTGRREGASLEALNAQVVLGLERAEDGFIAPMPLVAGRWFSDDAARELVLSVEAAALLGYGPADVEGANAKPTVRLMGRRLSLVGLVDDASLASLEDQGEMPLLPLLSPPQVDMEEQAPDEAGGSASLDPASGPAEGAPGVRPARPIDVAIVPAELAASMPGASYRALSVKYGGAADGARNDDTAPGSASARAWEAANRLVDFQHLRVQVGVTERVTPERGGSIEPGQYAMASRSTTQVGGILKVAIPIALGATIIFNTMLGAVMERRREISIYNAIGLNPTHVMIFFLAESLVFGLVGAVAGYLIGQILSVLITRFDIVDLNLNYSSLSVMLVIFITIATVLLSTIYPAVMAARAAVPSGQRKWSLPQPEDDEIRLTFPFLYDDRHVLGVCAYLREYMQQNTEASTGKFLARAGPIGTVPGAASADEGHDRALAMLFDVAPAPFDLGVNQRMEVYAFYDTRVGAYMLGLHLTRLSGQQGNWVTVNQPFLEAMRKRLLGWRSQRSELQQAFCEQGEALFGDARPLPSVSGTD